MDTAHQRESGTRATQLADGRDSSLDQTTHPDGIGREESTQGTGATDVAKHSNPSAETRDSSWDRTAHVENMVSGNSASSDQSPREKLDEERKDKHELNRKRIMSHEKLIEHIAKQDYLISTLTRQFSSQPQLRAASEVVQADSQPNAPETHENDTIWCEGYESMVPKYTTFPEVEVTMNLNGMSRFNPEDMTFLADFTVMLDWVDDALEKDKHFSRRGKSYELRNWVEGMVFNPLILVENASKELLPMKGADDIPRVGDFLECEDGEVLVWMKKTMRYRGMLHCGEHNTECFPFDVMRIGISLKALKPIGPDDLEFRKVVAKERTPNLVDPVIRAEQFPKKYKDGHKFRESDISLGELQVKAYGSAHVTKGSDHYTLVFGFKRQWTRYVFDFGIQMVMVILSILSLFVDPFEEEALPNRAGISMMLMLTLVTFTMERPRPIEFISSATIHDKYKRTCVMVTVCNAVLACAIVIFCKKRVSQEAEEHDHYIDTAWCHQSPLGTTWLDGGLTVFIIAIMMLVHARFFYMVVHSRHEQMIALQNHIDGKKFNSQTFDSKCDSLGGGGGGGRDSVLSNRDSVSFTSDAFSTKTGAMRVKKHASDGTFTFELLEHRYEDTDPWKQLLQSGFRGFILQTTLPCLKRWKMVVATQASHEENAPKMPRRKISKTKILRRSASSSVLKTTGDRAIPSVPHDRPVFVLDIGPNQLGLHRFEIQNDCGPASKSSEKMKFSLQDALEEIAAGETLEMGLVQDTLTEGLHRRGSSTADRKSSLQNSPLIEDKYPTCNCLVGYLVDHLKDQAGVGQIEIFVGFSADRESNLEFGVRGLMKYIKTKVRDQEKIDCRFTIFFLSAHQVARYEMLAVDYLMQHGQCLESHRLATNSTAVVPGHATPSDTGSVGEPPGSPQGSIIAKLSEVDLQYSEEDDNWSWKETARWLKKEILHELERKSRKLGRFTRMDFIQGFGDLQLGQNREATSQTLAQVFRKTDSNNSGELSWQCLKKMFLKSTALLHAFIRSRLFVGVIGSSWHSLYVTRKEGEWTGDAYKRRASKASLYSVPLGAGDRDGFFKIGRPVEESQLAAWRKHVVEMLEESNGSKGKAVPKDELGLFVGVSAVFHAAWATGITGRLLPKEFVLKKMQSKLSQAMLSGRSSNGDEQLMIANLALVIEVIKRVLHKDSWLFFQSKWKVPTKCDVGANWAFGWYVEGEPNCEAFQRKDLYRSMPMVDSREGVLEQNSASALLKESQLLAHVSRHQAPPEFHLPQEDQSQMMLSTNKEAASPERKTSFDNRVGAIEQGVASLDHKMSHAIAKLESLREEVQGSLCPVLQHQQQVQADKMLTGQCIAQPNNHELQHRPDEKHGTDHQGFQCHSAGSSNQAVTNTDLLLILNSSQQLTNQLRKEREQLLEDKARLESEVAEVSTKAAEESAKNKEQSGLKSSH